MQTVASYVEFDIELSEREREAVKRLLSGNKVKFEVLKDARIQVKIQVTVKDATKERE